MFPENPNAVWAANGEFSMSAERAREVSWGLGGGQTGIIGPESLQVRATPTPGGNVRVLPGMFTMAATPEHLTMQTGYTSAPWQSYMRGVYQTQTVPISPTSSSGSRIDTIGIVIDDPQYEGTTDSVDWENHQFWRFHVVENAPVGSTRPHHFGSLGRPFMPLAQIQMPANTATITNSMIRDLRFLAVERERTREYSEPANPSGGNLEIPSGQTDWVSLPEIGGVTIPQWATHLQLKAHLTSLRVQGGTASGFMRAQFNTGAVGWQSTEPTIIRASGSFDQLSFMTVGRIALDYDSRNTGRDGVIRLQIRRTSGGSGGTIVVPSFDAHSSQMDVRAIFEESPRTSS